MVRSSSINEYASWYLHRQARNGDTRPIPNTAEQQVQTMRERHDGKMRKWFDTFTRWNIVLFEASEMGRLVFLESDWTKQEGLVVPGAEDYRLLDRVADKAMQSAYLERPSAHKHKAYYDALASGSLNIAGDERVAICTAEASEIMLNPSARYYLLDGVGRCLPYMILTKAGKIQGRPVEAFLAERAIA